MLIPYLLPDRYYGIEPNSWLIDDCLDRELGRDIISIKRPRFDDNADFRLDVFDCSFDFIVAQSIFSHATVGIVSSALGNMRGVLADGGLVVCTFIEAEEGSAAIVEEGWIYPGCVTYTSSEINRLFVDAELAHARIPWFHPRQTWFVAARESGDLPTDEEARFLAGAVLRDPEFAASLR